MAKRTNIRRRGKAWVVYFRVNGKQHWKSFQTRDEAELYLSRSREQVIRGEHREPVNVTVREAADEWLRHAEHERGCRASTLRGYRSDCSAHVVPDLGGLRLRDLTPRAIEAWRGELVASAGLSPRSVNRLLTNLYGILERARKRYGLPHNPAAGVERLPERYSGDLAFFSPEEVMALARAAKAEQDGAIFLTAAFTGLRRGELVALRWRDVDFANEVIRVRASVNDGTETSPKSGKVRSVPMVPAVAEALARLGQREPLPPEDSVVFPGSRGGYLDPSALRRRYAAALKAAGLRPLRFHDLRHTFGSLAINRASIVQVQSWMGHADIETTMRYLHHKSRAGEAQLLAEAFKTEDTTASILQADACAPVHSGAEVGAAT